MVDILLTPGLEKVLVDSADVQGNHATSFDIWLHAQIVSTTYNMY